MNKKIISLVLILSLVVSLCPFSAFASVSTPDALQAFGVATDAEATADKITRSAFVTMAVRMSGVNMNLYAGEIVDYPFTDVSASAAEYPYIKAAYDMGLVSGNGSGIFGGNDQVTLHQAAKILVTLLGYKEKAEALGGYPYGYMNVANEKDLFDNMADLDAAAPLSADAARELILNALESTFVSLSSIGADTKYDESDNMYMSKMLGIYKITGVLEQNEYTSVYGKSSLGENEIQIGSVVLNAGDTNAADLIGCYVDCYFKEESGKEQVVYIEANEENNSLTLTSREIEKAASSVTELHYYNGDEDLKVKISSDAFLIKNGNQATLNLDNLCPANGEVTLISNDGDKVYDVVIAYDYTTIVAQSVSTNPASIVDAITGEVHKFDPEDGKIFVELNGEKAAFSDLAQNDVVSYYVISGDNAAKKLVASRNVVSGTVESVEGDKIYIGGTQYYIDASLTSKIEPGQLGNFYVDIYGTIVHYDIVDEISVYGILTKIRTDKGLASVVKVRIFTQNGRWVDLDVNKKVKLNGSAMTDMEFYAAMNDTKKLDQLICYTVNAAGKLTSLTTALDCSKESAERVQQAIDNDEFRISHPTFSGTWKTTLYSFDNTCALTKDSVIFLVPADRTKEEEYSMGGRGNLSNSSTYTVISYNESETRITDLVVVEKKGANADTNFMIFDSIGRVVLNGEEIPCMYGTYGTHGSTCVYVANDAV
ncbi:MAG: S-layer homology domain-containing protein, partial [Clostridia bacterium]|nr:S-layer homology domain-containing protein [Clostridia bacterium]